MIIRHNSVATKSHSLFSALIHNVVTIYNGYIEPPMKKCVYMGLIIFAKSYI